MFGDLRLFLFLLIKLSLILGGCLLILLVFRHQVVHVGLGLSELHLIRTLTSEQYYELKAIPRSLHSTCVLMEESLNIPVKYLEDAVEFTTTVVLNLLVGCQKQQLLHS